MDSLVKIAGSYRERDKLIRVVQYVCKFVSGSAQTNMGKKLAVIAVQLGSCRATLRLFDDIPMLSHTLRYGLGSKESNQWLRFLEVLGNVANQLFFPLEHVAWFARHQLVDQNPNGWAAWCNYAWATSLLSEILKAITRIVLLRKARSKLIKESGVEGQTRGEDGEMHSSIQNQLRVLKSQELHCYLTVIEHGTDFTNSVNWMAPGILWSATLSNRTVGLLGTISSLIKIVRLHNPALVTGK